MRNNENCNCNSCSVAGIVISVLFGAAIGVLFAFGFIPNIVVSTWIALGLGVVTLPLLVFGILLAETTEPNRLSNHLSKNTTFLLVGIFGTIISALVALSIVLTPVLIPVIALVAIVAFFFSLMIISLISLISCIL